MKKNLVQLALNPFFGWFKVPENPISVPNPSLIPTQLPLLYLASPAPKRSCPLYFVLLIVQIQCQASSNVVTRKMAEGCPKFCVKKLFTSDSVPQKIRHAILKWSFLCNYCETPDCLTKISVELNPIKFFCNNNEIEIIGTLISFPVEWQFFYRKGNVGTILCTVWTVYFFKAPRTPTTYMIYVEHIQLYFDIPTVCIES